MSLLLTLKTAYVLDTEKYEMVANSKKSAKSQETTISRSETMPNTSDNVPTIALSKDIVSQRGSKVNAEASPKTDTEESIFDADVPMRHIDGGEQHNAYYANQDEQQYFLHCLTSAYRSVQLQHMFPTNSKPAIFVMCLPRLFFVRTICIFPARHHRLRRCANA